VQLGQQPEHSEPHLSVHLLGLIDSKKRVRGQKESRKQTHSNTKQNSRRRKVHITMPNKDILRKIKQIEKKNHLHHRIIPGRARALDEPEEGWP